MAGGNPSTHFEPDDRSDRGTIERRLFAPSPPCTAFDEATGRAELPPGLPIDWPHLSFNEKRKLLIELADVLDKLHGFRLAHGDLEIRDVYQFGQQLWLARVGARWSNDVEAGGHRKKDLLAYRRFCMEWRDDPAQEIKEPDRTARGILAGFLAADQHTTLPSPIEKERAQSAPFSTDVSDEDLLLPISYTSTPVSLMGVVVGLLLCTMVAAGAAFWTYRNNRSENAVIDGSGPRSLEPSQPKRNQQREARRPSDGTVRLDAYFIGLLNIYNRRAMIEALCIPDPAATELLLQQIDRNDTGFHSVLGNLVDPTDSWAPQAAPRLIELLDKPQADSGKRSVERAFLFAARPEDLPRVRKLLNSSRQETVADACWALARLGAPLTPSQLKAFAAKANNGVIASYIELALAYFPLDDVRELLNSALFDSPHRPRPILFQITPNRTPAGSESALRLDENLAILYLETLHRLAGHDDTTADNDLLATMAALWRLTPIAPDEMVERLKLSTADAEVFRKRFSRRLLLGDDQGLPDGVEVPETWFTTAVAWAEVFPKQFLRRTQERAEFRNPRQLSAVQRQTRLLALSELRSRAAQEEMSIELDALIDSEYQAWKAHQPESLQLMSAVLAVADAPAALHSLEQFFSGEPTAREPCTWDGFLIGSCIAEPKHRAILEKAARHPLPTIWRPARDRLSLANANVGQFREGPGDPPTLSTELFELVLRLNECHVEADIESVLSKERDNARASTALSLSRSNGARSLLLRRMDHNESLYATITALANQPLPFDARHFDEYVRREPIYQLVEQPVMRGCECRNDTFLRSAIMWVALGPYGGRTSPPVGNRITALAVVGTFHRKGADAKMVRDLLKLSVNDPSRLIRRHSAAAALKVVKAEDRNLLKEAAETAKAKDPVVYAILKLADRI